jgi:hypothetical protein
VLKPAGCQPNAHSRHAVTKGVSGSNSTTVLYNLRSFADAVKNKIMVKFSGPFLAHFLVTSPPTPTTLRFLYDTVNLRSIS